MSEQAVCVQSSRKLNFTVIIAVLFLHTVLGFWLVTMEQSLLSMPRPQPISIEFLNMAESVEPPSKIPTKEIIKPTPEPKPVQKPLPKELPKEKVKPLPKPKERKVEPPKPESTPEPKPVQKPIEQPQKLVQVKQPVEQNFKVQEQELTEDINVALEAQRLAKLAAEQAAAQAKLLEQEKARQEQIRQEQIKQAQEQAAEQKRLAEENAKRKAAEQRANEQRAETERLAKLAAEQAAAQAKARAAAEQAKNNEPIILSESQVAASWRNKPNLNFSAEDILDLGEPKKKSVAVSFNFDTRGNISHINLQSTGNSRLDRELKNRLTRAKLHPQSINGIPKSGKASFVIAF